MNKLAPVDANGKSMAAHGDPPTPRRKRSFRRDPVVVRPIALTQLTSLPTVGVPGSKYLDICKRYGIGTREGMFHVTLVVDFLRALGLDERPRNAPALEALAAEPEDEPIDEADIVLAALGARRAVR